MLVQRKNKPPLTRVAASEGMIEAGQGRRPHGVTNQDLMVKNFQANVHDLFAYTQQVPNQDRFPPRSLAPLLL